MCNGFQLIFTWNISNKFRYPTGGEHLCMCERLQAYDCSRTHSVSCGGEGSGLDVLPHDISWRHNRRFNVFLPLAEKLVFSSASSDNSLLDVEATCQLLESRALFPASPFSSGAGMNQRKELVTVLKCQSCANPSWLQNKWSVLVKGYLSERHSNVLLSVTKSTPPQNHDCVQRTVWSFLSSSIFSCLVPTNRFISRGGTPASTFCQTSHSATP